MDVVSEAVRRGIIAEDDAPRVGSQQAWALGVIIGMMDSEEMDEPVSEFEICMYSQELQDLGDMLDLRDFDRVEPGKTFDHDEVAVIIPEFLVPLMRSFVLPAIREVLESVDN